MERKKASNDVVRIKGYTEVTNGEARKSVFIENERSSPSNKTINDGRHSAYKRDLNTLPVCTQFELRHTIDPTKSKYSDGAWIYNTSSSRAFVLCL